MTTEQLTMTLRTRSFFSSFVAYLKERFPVPVIALLALGTGLGAYATAQQATVGAGAPLVIDGTALAGCLMVFLFLFHLRVFDEHKDYQIDAETRPDRPVQRGLITLGQLKVAGGVALAAQVGLALIPGIEAGWWYAIPLGYSVLMYYEFFARDWLSARIGWYAFTHSLVMSLVALALGLRFTEGVGLGIPAALWGFVGLNLVSTIGIDVFRKTWAPESEIDGLDSWSKRLGIARAGALAIGVLVAAAALAGFTGWELGGRFGWLAVVAAVTAWSIFEVVKFVRAPSPKGEKKLEAVSGVHLLTLYFGVVVIAALQNGAAIGIGSRGFTLGT